ncbi:MAG: hypothetical protein OEY15_10580, partial [Myxococcales bacterium]|nr:hypothetical protein [Myxococcales bacterium]
MSRVATNTLAAALLLALADAAFARSSCPPVELLYDDNEQIAERRTDTNQDCRHDEFVHYSAGVAERAERDTDHDGRIDVWLFFEADGKTPARQDQDVDADGQKDRWVTFRAGRPSIQLDDRNADGKPDA